MALPAAPEMAHNVGATGPDPGRDGEADRRAIAAGRPNRCSSSARRRRLPATRCRCSAARTAGASSSCAARATTAPTASSRPAVLRHRGVGVDVFHARGPADRRRATGRPRARSTRADLFVDAMFGTGFRGALDGDAALDRARGRRSGVATLAVDIPSGVDGATGAVAGAAVHADETVCFAALKPGLLFEPGRAHAGRVTSSTSASDRAGDRRARLSVPELDGPAAAAARRGRAQVVDRAARRSAARPG